MMNWETLAQTMPKEINGVPIDAVTREIAYLLTDFRYGEAARMQVKDCKVVVYQRLAKSIEEILRRHDIRGVLLEHENLTLAQADIYETVCKQWNAVPVKDTTLDTLLKEMRAVKTEKEIENIKAAQSITDAAFTHILNYIDTKKLHLTPSWFREQMVLCAMVFRLIRKFKKVILSLWILVRWSMDIIPI